MSPRLSSSIAHSTSPLDSIAERGTWALPVGARRAGFIGSHEMHGLLRHDLPTLALTPMSAVAAIESGALQALVVEHSLDPMEPSWGSQLYHFRERSDLAAAVYAARSMAVPIAVVSRGDVSDLGWLLDLAKIADLVLVCSDEVRARLLDAGVDDVVVFGAVFQPRDFNQFLCAQEAAVMRSGLLSLQLEEACKVPGLAVEIESLAGQDVDICSPRSQPSLRSALAIDGLTPGRFGAVSPLQRRYLFKTKIALVQFADFEQSKIDAVQDAVEAAASGCVVVVLGIIRPSDPRFRFAHVFHDVREMNLFLSRLTLDPLWAKQLRLRNWRHVWKHHTCSRFVRHLTDLLGAAPNERNLLASVVVPTMRPENYRAVIERFRSQTWSGRELIVVANTDDPELWTDQEIELEDSESLIFLPAKYGPGAALNLGFGLATGDYLVRMDDDDLYSNRYIEDNMIVATELDPDLIGLLDEVYFFSDEDKLVAVNGVSDISRKFDGDDFLASARLAGFSHVVHRRLMSRLGYPGDALNAADTRFLRQVGEEGRGLLCLRRADTDAVVCRSSDNSRHTWKLGSGSSSERFRDISAEVDPSDDDLLRWT